MGEAGRKILDGLKELLAVVRGEQQPALYSVWHVDRDGRVRKDTDRAVVLRAK